jgi:16S rRNA G966 N2-methylase RsmD
VERVTVQQAALALGVTEQAVRKRIKRGTLESERENGRVYVFLDPPYTGYEPSRDAVTNHELIEELRDRVRSLEEANRENRRIIMQQAQNLAAIEAPENDAQASDVEEPPADTEGSRKSWWKRLLGR